MVCQLNFTATDDHSAEYAGGILGQASWTAGASSVRSGAIGLEAFAFAVFSGDADIAAIRYELHKEGYDSAFVGCR